MACMDIAQAFNGAVEQRAVGSIFVEDKLAVWMLGSRMIEINRYQQFSGFLIVKGFSLCDQKRCASGGERQVSGNPLGAVEIQVLFWFQTQ